MIYKSERKFKIWAYTVSHNSLLLRSVMKFQDDREYSKETSFNIDIEFWAVEYINLPTTLNNIRISDGIILPLYENKNSKKFSKGAKVFEIEESGSIYYIVAGGLIVATNKWENKDRISNYDLDLKHDEIVVTV
jgi:hypothetical protein